MEEKEYLEFEEQGLTEEEKESMSLGEVIQPSTDFTLNFSNLEKSYTITMPADQIGKLANLLFNEMYRFGIDCKITVTDR